MRIAKRQIQKHLKLVCVFLGYKGISQAALARLIETTPSNFNQKMKRGTFTVEELEKIASEQIGY